MENEDVILGRGRLCGACRRRAGAAGRNGVDLGRGRGREGAVTGACAVAIQDIGDDVGILLLAQALLQSLSQVSSSTSTTEQFSR